jgi:hypothetical protein
MHSCITLARGSQDAPAADAYEREEASAYHLCVYIDHMDRFRESFSACEALGVLYANQRFANSPPEFGNAMEWELARTCGQFRIKDMGPAGASAEAAVDVSDGSGGAVSGGGAALVLELEVRSVMHKSCPLSRAVRSSIEPSLEPSIESSRADPHTSHEPPQRHVDRTASRTVR